MAGSWVRNLGASTTGHRDMVVTSIGRSFLETSVVSWSFPLVGA